MKKVSFRVRNFEKEQFLTFNIDNEAELDEELLDFLEDEEPRGIVPVIFEDEDEEFDTFSYNITDKIRLIELSDQEINAEMVLLAMRGLVFALIDMAEYRVPLSYLVLHRNYIYIDSDYKVEFICIPLADMQEEVDINHFLRNFIASLRFEPSENGDYVAKMLSYVNNTAIFNLRNFLTLIEDLMDDMGIEIPEDNTSNIYVDYQEVEDEKDAVDLVEELDADMDEEEVSISVQSEEQDSAALTDRETVLEEELVSEEETVLKEAEEKEKAEVISEEAVNEEEEEIVSEEAVDEEEEETVSEEAVNEEEEETVSEEAVDEEEEETVLEEAEEEEKENIVLEETVNEEEEETVSEEAEEEEKESIISEETVNEEKAETVSEEAEDTDFDEAQGIVEEMKKKIFGGDKSTLEADNEDSEEESANKKKGIKKPTFKTKEATITGVVIQDELDEFLAEKEKEDQEVHHEETGLKIKKNIKINRASILKNTQEELKATEETAGEAEETESAKEDGEEENNSVSNQASDAEDALKAAPVPKANPYLIRVNTGERIMITKQTFKIGKASMGVDYTVKGNSAVSRIHAIITNKDDGYYVKDNKSTNHTFVNGKVIDDGENGPLANDNKIVLGDEEFIFKLG